MKHDKTQEGLKGRESNRSQATLIAHCSLLLAIKDALPDAFCTWPLRLRPIPMIPQVVVVAEGCGDTLMQSTGLRLFDLLTL